MVSKACVAAEVASDATEAAPLMTAVAGSSRDSGVARAASRATVPVNRARERIEMAWPATLNRTAGAVVVVLADCGRRRAGAGDGPLGQLCCPDDGGGKSEPGEQAGDGAWVWFEGVRGSRDARPGSGHDSFSLLGSLSG